MQYTIHGSDGNQYGPVDLITLKKWVAEGRVLPNSQVTDNLANRTIMASQMPELGMMTQSNPYANAPAPPSVNQQYGGAYSGPMQVPQGTKLWGIIGWLCAALVLSAVTRYGGLIISGWNIFDAIKAKSYNDPKSGWCFAVAIGGFAVIALWTYIKYQTNPGGY